MCMTDSYQARSRSGKLFFVRSHRNLHYGSGSPRESNATISSFIVTPYRASIVFSALREFALRGLITLNSKARREPFTSPIESLKRDVVRCVEVPHEHKRRRPFSAQSKSPSHRLSPGTGSQIRRSDNGTVETGQGHGASRGSLKATFVALALRRTSDSWRPLSISGEIAAS